METTKTTSVWDDFLNPDLVRSKLAAAGVFLVGFELLRAAIIRHPLAFFADSYSGDALAPEESPRYRQEVRERDPRGKSDALRGSMAFLRHMEAIDEADENIFEALVRVRNEVAHELPSFLMEGRHLNCTDRLLELVALLRKIERFWVVNVEIATDPDMSRLEFEVDDVQPGSVLMFETLVCTAIGDDEAARAFYEAFRSSRV